MFNTLRSKLITIVALILLLTATVIIYLTHRDVGREIMHSEQKNVENIMDMVFLNIQGVYRGLISDRIISILQNKDRLTRETGVILSALELYLADPEMIDKQMEGLRRARFMDWLNGLEMGATRFFIADDHYEIVLDSGKNLINQRLTNIEDIKGQPLSSIVNRPGATYEQFAVFSFRESDSENAVEKLAYLAVIPHWQWVLGAFVDLSYIQAAEKARLQELIRGLQEQFREVRIAGSGSVFIFNADGEMIVPPARIENIQALKLNFSDLIQDISNTEHARIRVDGETMIAYTRYFRPLNWYLSALIPESAIQAPAKRLVQRQSIIIAGIFLLGILAAVFFVRQISRPLGILASQARELANGDLTSDVFDSGQISDLTKRYRDEVGALAGSFMFMQEALRKNVRRLLASTKANERIESELLIARNIQMSFLPQLFPPFPDRNEFDIFAILEPAKHVGGDLYDFFLIDDDHLFVLVGDVSDKGVPAALFMAVTKTLIKGIIEQGHEPSEVLARVNNELCQGNNTCMFVTLFCGILNLPNGELRYTNAGHNPPVLQSPGQAPQWLEMPSGMVLGGMEDSVYQTMKLELSAGDKLLMYTDGVTEAMNPNKELYSETRLEQEIQARATATPEALVVGILETVHRFSGDAPQSDDITMVALLYNGKSELQP